MAKPLDPGHIMQIGMGFMANKTLLTAVEFGLYTRLGEASMTASELGGALELHERSRVDFLDALVALGLLAREGDGEEARYANTPETSLFLTRESPAYVGGILEMANQRLYGFWAHLGEALRTGEPQNEIKQTGKPIFEAIYANEAMLEGFLNAMAGVSTGSFMALAEKFDFSEYKTLCDVGGANGALSIQLARRHPNLKLSSFDLPIVTRVAERTVAAAGLDERVDCIAGSFLDEALPKADVITMSNVLHDWGTETKQNLVKAAYDALPEGGAFIALESVIDDARRENAFGLLMSLNMLIETPDGYDYTGADFARWAHEAGFSDVQVLPLAGPTSACIATK